MQIEDIKTDEGQATDRRSMSAGQRSSSRLPSKGLASNCEINTLEDVDEAMAQEQPGVRDRLYQGETNAASKIASKLFDHGTLSVQFSGEMTEVGSDGEKDAIPEGPSTLELVKEMLSMIHRYKLERQYHLPLLLASCKKGSIACVSAAKEPRLRNAHVGEIVTYIRDKYMLHGTLYWEHKWDYLRGVQEMKQIVPNAESCNKGMVLVAQHVDELGTALCKPDREMDAKWKLVTSKALQQQVLSGYTVEDQLSIS